MNTYLHINKCVPICHLGLPLLKGLPAPDRYVCPSASLTHRIDSETVIHIGSQFREKVIKLRWVYGPSPTPNKQFRPYYSFTYRFFLYTNPDPYCCSSFLELHLFGMRCDRCLWLWLFCPVFLSSVSTFCLLAFWSKKSFALCLFHFSSLPPFEFWRRVTVLPVWHLHSLWHFPIPDSDWSHNDW